MDERDGVAQSLPAAVPGGSELSVSTSWSGDCRVVTAVGQIDVTNAHRLHHALTVALHPDRPLIADLSLVTFFDSRGIRMLMAMQRNAAAQDALLLVVPSAEIAALMLLGAVDDLEIYPSVDAAQQRPAAASATDTPPVT